MVDVAEGVEGKGGKECEGKEGERWGKYMSLGVGRRSQAGRWTSAETQMVLSEVECDEIEDGKGSEINERFW